MNETLLQEAKKIVRRKKQFFHVAIPMIAYLIIWNKFGKLKDRKDKLEADAVAEEYFKLKEKHKEEIYEDERLELKELERRYNDRDYV